MAPGDYELAWKIHASTEGCLVHPLSMGVQRISVAPGQKALDLGRVTATSLPVLNQGDMAPDFEFVDSDGAKTKLSDLRGRPVLLDFWATWCAPCVAKLGEVEHARQQFSETKGLIVLGVNLDDDPARAQALIHERKLPWRHALLGHWAATDVPRQFAVSAVPTYVLIDAEGRIMARGSAIEEMVEKLNKAESHSRR